MTRQTVRFLLNDTWCEIAAIDPTLTLLDWLRLDRRLTGTKEGCAEGDCGACTVLIGRPVPDGLRYEAINACIRFVPTLDGCHVVTVEHLKHKFGGLHPVQQAMVELHGSQCGFCTPGIVMSLMALWLEHAGVPTRARIEEALAGNLCRCTGYGPIVAALARAHEIAPQAADLFRQEREAVALNLARHADTEVLEVGREGRRLFAPATADQLADLYLAHPEATLVAGATDVGLWVTKEMHRPQTVISLGRLRDLDWVEETAGKLTFGAMVSLADARLALARLHPEIDELMRRFGSEQVRNAGTIGGNVANGSPIGDTPPMLIALGAEVGLRRGDARRTLPLEKYFIAYKKQDRQPGEFVEKIIVPKPAKDVLLHISKISKRLDEDITAVLGAFYLRRDAQGLVSEARFAFGGMAATPKRGAAAEAAVLGKTWSVESAEAAAQALAQDFAPLDDWRATAKYRSLVAANLLRRFAIETVSAPNPVSGGARTRVVDVDRSAA